MEPLNNWEVLSREVKADRRRGKRVHLTFPIEVSGFDRTGKMFCERTVTLDISEAGCRILLKSEVNRGDVVAIKLLGRFETSKPPARPLQFQIVWTDREDGAWLAGALKLQPEEIWRVHFPPDNQPKTPTA